MKRVYRKTANAMGAHYMLIPKEKRSPVIYARYRDRVLYHIPIHYPTHIDLVDAESKPGFVSFFIYE